MKTIFTTERMQLAIYLHAAERLRLIECVQTRPGTIEFVFDDPQQRGMDYEFEFNKGAAISALALFASQKYLRQMMGRANEKKQKGKENDRQHTADRAD
jgi:hypothetical protein